jgi:hypothetical protein
MMWGWENRLVVVGQGVGRRGETRRGGAASFFCWLGAQSGSCDGGRIVSLDLVIGQSLLLQIHGRCAWRCCGAQRATGRRILLGEMKTNKMKSGDFYLGGAARQDVFGRTAKFTVECSLLTFGGRCGGRMNSRLGPLGECGDDGIGDESIAFAGIAPAGEHYGWKTPLQELLQHKGVALQHAAFGYR